MVGPRFPERELTPGQANTVNPITSIHRPQSTLARFQASPLDYDDSIPVVSTHPGVAC